MVPFLFMMDLYRAWTYIVYVRVLGCRGGCGLIMKCHKHDFNHKKEYIISDVIVLTYLLLESH